MNRLIITTLLLSFIFILAACADKDLTKSEVLEKVSEKAEGVNSYLATLDAKFSLELASSTEISSHHSKVSVNEEKNEIESVFKSEQNGEVSLVNTYIKDGELYEKINDDAWENDDKHMINVRDSSINAYARVMNFFQWIEDDLEFDTTKNYYIFSFKGISTRDYHELNVPYLDGDLRAFDTTDFDEKDINHDLEIKIDKKSLHIIEITNTMVAENAGAKAEFIIKRDFTEINKINEIDIPETVLTSLN